MRKIVIIIGIIFIYLFFGQIKTNARLIPEEAIRFRVIPNSNEEEDQDLKIKVRDEVQRELFRLLQNTKGIEDARTKIEENIGKIDNIVKDTIENYEKSYGYEVRFGRNYFPEKTYKGVSYEAGEYESLVITLGKGEGDNWWCVLFPPLCLIETDDSTDEVEYKFFIQELIDKYL